MLWEKKLSYVFCFAWKVFKWCRTASASSYFFFSSVNYRRIYSIHSKNLCFAEDVLFYPKNEVIAFPKIKIKWDWVSDVYVYIWESNYGPQLCVVQTNSRVKRRWFYSGMSKFNRLVVVLFSAMFSCFLLDSFVLQYARDYMHHQCLTRLRSSYICIVLQRCMLRNGWLNGSWNMVAAK